MHEISLCRSLLSIIEEQAQSNSFERVNKVFLEVGALASVELDALRFGFAAVMKESIAEGAALEIIEIPGRARCGQCDNEVTLQQRFAACPVCGAVALQLEQGDELRIRELEVE